MLPELILTNFRNFKKLKLQLLPEVNLLIGPNAQGKTNLLEAVHLLSTTRSFRTSRESDLIHFKEDSAYVAGGEVEVFISPGEKKIRLRGKEARSAEVMGALRSVLFAPQDMGLLSGPPQVRRAFIDELISRIDRKYLLNLISYLRSLKQRNRMLWLIREGRGDLAELESWDEIVVRDGTEILVRRLEVVEKLRLRLEKLAPELLGEKVKLTYLSRIETTDPSIESLKARFAEGLVNSREADIRSATTLTGPHRDDFEVVLANRNLGRFGSRGEQRAAILALKLAEVSLNEEELGSRPLLLLDDVLSELDRDHQSRLLSEVDKQQTIISSTSTEAFPSQVLEKARIYSVLNGEVVKTSGL